MTIARCAFISLGLICLLVSSACKTTEPSPAGENQPEEVTEKEVMETRKQAAMTTDPMKIFIGQTQVLEVVEGGKIVASIEAFEGHVATLTPEARITFPSSEHYLELTEAGAIVASRDGGTDPIDIALIEEDGTMKIGMNVHTHKKGARAVGYAPDGTLTGVEDLGEPLTEVRVEGLSAKNRRQASLMIFFIAELMEGRDYSVEEDPS